MKVMVEGLTLERRDGLIAIGGISEVLVRGTEVLLLPIGADYVPPTTGNVTIVNPVVSLPEGADEEKVVEEIKKLTAKKRGRPKAAKTAGIKPAEESKPEPKRSLDPTGGKGDASMQTLRAIHELGGGTGAMVAERCGITLEACLARLTKLRINDLVIATGVRPKKWKLTGKGLDALDGR